VANQDAALISAIILEPNRELSRITSYLWIPRNLEEEEEETLNIKSLEAKTSGENLNQVSMGSET
jgi:hypothetical protein